LTISVSPPTIALHAREAAAALQVRKAEYVSALLLRAPTLVCLIRSA
jgi:hypothetical protein